MMKANLHIRAPCDLGRECTCGDASNYLLTHVLVVDVGCADEATMATMLCKQKGEHCCRTMSMLKGANGQGGDWDTK